MEYQQGNPYCIQVELSEGCNLRCSFCGLNGIRGKENNYKFMTLETAERVASDMKEYGWNSRVEFAMHGEPTMNPHFVEIIAIFRKHLPRAYLLMESNGGGLLIDPIESITALFQAGLTTLALDEYQQVKLVEKIWTKLFPYNDEVTGGSLKDGSVLFADAKVFDYPECGKPGNPHQRNKHKRLVRIRPIDLSTSGTHAMLNNHAGAGAAPNEKAQGRRCAKPFREISVRWDGGVAVCCNDWRGVLPIGNVNETSLEDIWHDPVMYAARRKLYAGERDFAACNGCDALSYRPGILPDHLGKAELDAPSLEDEAIIEEAISKGPLTKPVLRPWEIPE
mgnify:CR=1 FL=1